VPANRQIVQGRLLTGRTAWDFQGDFDAWFENYVKPALPEGAPAPSIRFDELNDVRLAG
jgi:hypothetical protein